MRIVKVCPVCGIHVPLVERKDAESFTGREYVDHVKSDHPERVGPIGIPYGQELVVEEVS